MNDIPGNALCYLFLHDPKKKRIWFTQAKPDLPAGRPDSVVQFYNCVLFEICVT
jgi:hypothetical protein